MRSARIAVVMLVAVVGSCRDAARPPMPASIEFDVPSDWVMALGAWDTVTATVRDAAGTELPGFPVTWSCENPDILLVGQDGLLIADSVGSVLVSATAGSITSSFRVRVERTMAILEVTPSDTALQIHGRVQLRLRLLDGKGEEWVGVPIVPTYATSDSGLLVVDDTGAVTGVGWGSGVITVVANGVTGTVTIASAPRELDAGGAQLVRIDVGDFHQCGLDAAGAAYCAGSNPNGETGYPIGVGDTTRLLPVPTSLRFKLLTTGQRITCGITHAGEIWCWGLDIYAGFGLGRRSLSRGPTPIRAETPLAWQYLDAGQHSAMCGIPDAGTGVDGVIHCWGHNDGGQAGRLPWAQYDSIIAPIAGDFVAMQASVGTLSGCGVASTGATVCWGFISEDASRLPALVSGLPALASVSVTVDAACGLTGDGAAYCWSPNSRTPAPAAGDVRFSKLVAGGGTACGITTAGRLYCWRMLISGATPVSFGPSEHSYFDVASGRWGMCAITTQHRVFCW